MNDAAVRARIREHYTRSAEPAKDLLGTLFPQSRAFAEDPSLLKYAICTRRAAKSYSTGVEFLDSALRYGNKHLILGLTRESVRGAFWDDVLKAIDQKHGLGLEYNETRLEVRTPNGGTIRLMGMDSNEREKKKALGQKYRKVNIDEAQDFTSDLEQLVMGVLGPAMADYRGTISVTGTPSNIMTGFFFKLTNGQIPGWSRHRWTTFDNPHMSAKWEEKIASLRQANPLIDRVSWFRQYYLGEWVIEKDSLVYRYERGHNDFDRQLPLFNTGGWHYALGCDLGFTDPTAWVVCAYHDHDRRLFILEAKKEAGLDVTGVAQRTREIMRRYPEFDRMVIDNANKQAVEELKRRHDLPWQAADKTGKRDFIEIMNGEFVLGNIVLCDAAEPLREEYEKLIWTDSREGERITGREEHPALPNHCCDASLYSWRACFPYLSEAEVPVAVIGTHSWYRAEEQKLLQGAVKQARLMSGMEETW